MDIYLYFPFSFVVQVEDDCTLLRTAGCLEPRSMLKFHSFSIERVRKDDALPIKVLILCIAQGIPCQGFTLRIPGNIQRVGVCSDAGVTRT